MVAKYTLGQITIHPTEEHNTNEVALARGLDRNYTCCNKGDEAKKLQALKFLLGLHH